MNRQAPHVTKQEALEALRRGYARFRRACPDMAARGPHVPFGSRDVPGWVYIPADDIVRPDPRASAVRDRGVGGGDPALEDGAAGAVHVLEERDDDDDFEDDDEVALCNAIERFAQYLHDRGAPVAHTRREAVTALSGRFLYGERKMFGVLVDDGCRMGGDENHPEFFKKWLSEHPDHVAIDTRWHAKKLIAAAKYATTLPTRITEFASRFGSQRRLEDGPPEAWYDGVHHAKALLGLAKALDISVEELLDKAKLADDLMQVRSASGGDHP